MAKATATTTLPWAKTEKWVKGEWYPMPIGYFNCDYQPYIIDGYKIFELDPDHDEGETLYGDITPVDLDRPTSAMTFSEALAICEARNKREMLK